MSAADKEIDIGFSAPDSIYLYLKSLRAFNSYEEEFLKEKPDAKKLGKLIDAAYDDLALCTRGYHDYAPHFLLGVVATAKNQMLYIEKIGDLQAEIEEMGGYLFLRHEIQKSVVSPTTTDQPAKQNEENIKSLKKKAKACWEKAAKFRRLKREPWWLLQQAATAFEFCQEVRQREEELRRQREEELRRQREEELKGTVRYNLAQVYARLGDDEHIEKGLRALSSKDRERWCPFDASLFGARLLYKAEVLYWSLIARRAIRDRKKDDFDASWKKMKAIEERIKNGEVPHLDKREVQSDCWVKMGFVLYEKALFLYENDKTSDSRNPPSLQPSVAPPLFDIDPCAELDQAKTYFGYALETRAAWNPAEIYSLLVEMLLLGASSSEEHWEKSIKRRGGTPRAKPSSADAETQEGADKIPAAIISDAWARGSKEHRQSFINRLLRSLGVTSQAQDPNPSNSSEPSKNQQEAIKKPEPGTSEAHSQQTKSKEP